MTIILIYSVDIVFFYKVKQIFLFEFEVADDHVLNAKNVYFLKDKNGSQLRWNRKIKVRTSFIHLWRKTKETGKSLDECQSCSLAVLDPYFSFWKHGKILVFWWKAYMLGSFSPGWLGSLGFYVESLCQTISEDWAPFNVSLDHNLAYK